MGMGKYNRITLQIIAAADITGDASENAIDANTVVLPCKAELVDCRVSCRTMAASKTALISIYENSVQRVDDVTLTSTALYAKGTLTAAYAGKVYDANSVFSAKEECTASSNVENLQVTLTFRAYGP